MEQSNNNAFENHDAETDPSEERSKREKVDCSHRVIEKRRRDRINNSLLQLSKLVPIEKFNKKNSGKLEKAEILEVTVHYLTQQQVQVENGNATQTSDETKQDNQTRESEENELTVFLRGFKQCITDATRFFQDVEELDVSEGRCYRLIQHLKKQITKYEKKERDLPKVATEERLVWDTMEAGGVSNRRLSVDSNTTKRKNEDLDGTPCKKPRNSQAESTNGEEPAGPGEQDRTSSGRPSSPSNCETSNNMDANSLRNYMPFVFPNMPMFATFPFPGANNMPRFQGSQTQFPGYQFQQSTPQYIPVALPQFPMMGMNFVPGFGMGNGEQAQNGGLPCSGPSTVPVTSGISSGAMPGQMPNGMPNGFFPSMYTNGLHANIMAMRPRDSGYESSEKSSQSSKASGSETSPQSFSDDSCQSYNS